KSATSSPIAISPSKRARAERRRPSSPRPRDGTPTSSISARPRARRPRRPTTLTTSLKTSSTFFKPSTTYRPPRPHPKRGSHESTSRPAARRGDVVVSPCGPRRVRRREHFRFVAHHANVRLPRDPHPFFRGLPHLDDGVVGRHRYGHPRARFQ